jgi:UPF0042 nucleotide-binding protein
VSGPASLVVVSGLSGAGRTTVMKALEDIGFYCADNLPVVLLDRFVDLFGEGASRLAVAVDVRERNFLEAFPAIHDELRARGILKELLFLEAEDGALAKRFSETRRSHPAARPGMSLMEGIAQERRMLAPIAQRADVVVDTTRMSVHDLKRFVTRRHTEGAEGGRMAVELLSFGFRYGVPEAADLMIDVRFLPNPNFEPALRDRSGADPEVAAYVLESTRTSMFLQRFFDFLDFLLPHYEDEGKAYLRIAIGCTGGRHRSVAVAGALDQHLRERRIDVRVAHRDVDRERREDG